ncbi:MAG: hypothetical protein Q7U98_11170 [Methylicorpusculum sp.]|uniref:hypothetical protein n=1 Tax=Methylicorpusculum sp. TaxID=2713644 RepID=UPI002719A72B|nr:hypothetical protein [Methylicorpusculum sp.]MDO8939710.1 hypothetical protein [Methylicorpusculum sp.]MDP2204606.1 hypothetical protein [Methylicorpusculum sp.]
MATCFVIQPFDSGKFDKRFDDIYKPSIEAAGLEPYRVDNDPGVSVPIDAIEDGIRKAAICLADITADNANVWYELGYAFASGRPVVMVCSEERTGKKYPFDIQHRTIIPYLADAPSDFDRLREKLTAKLKALIEKGEVLRNIAESDPVAIVEGLSHAEVLVLAVVAGSSYLPADPVSVYSCKRDAEQAGVTNMGFNLAVRRLITKKFAVIEQLFDEHAGESYDGISITDLGWSWIEANETRFVLHRSEQKEPHDSPF